MKVVKKAMPSPTRRVETDGAASAVFLSLCIDAPVQTLYNTQRAGQQRIRRRARCPRSESHC